MAFERNKNGVSMFALQDEFLNGGGNMTRTFLIGITVDLRAFTDRNLGIFKVDL